MTGFDDRGAVLVSEERHVLRVTLNRPEQHNGITGELLAAVHEALDRAERSPDCRLVVLEGAGGVFSTGMDFAEASRDGGGPDEVAAQGGELFYGLLKRFTTCPRVIVSVVDGRAVGGGVGLAAAGDFVLATERSSFSLPEALWGLLPACVLPFLIRRVGFQPAYAMTLSTLPVSAAEAARVRLVDELTDEPQRAVRRLGNRVAKLDVSVIRDMKDYFRRLWILNEDTERTAVAEFSRMMSSPLVRGRIGDFAAHQRFPWESPQHAGGGERQA
ncbi:enoyl-CoA hydratase-related protein [Streptomyces sp. NPDC058374]|uniref:enoyl-CoA hydratase-related protein n=1 Tax=unclassified Streptomyces TaxID=2593676 RepID=UPI003657AAE4